MTAACWPLPDTMASMRRRVAPLSSVPPPTHARAPHPVKGRIRSRGRGAVEDRSVARRAPSPQHLAPRRYRPAVFASPSWRCAVATRLGCSDERLRRSPRLAPSPQPCLHRDSPVASRGVVRSESGECRSFRLASPRRHRPVACVACVTLSQLQSLILQVNERCGLFLTSCLARVGAGRQGTTDPEAPAATGSLVQRRVLLLLTGARTGTRWSAPRRA